MDYAQQLAFFANILEQKRLVTALEGNASIIDRETGLTYITPSGRMKLLLQREDISVMDESGAQIGGRGKRSSEYLLHEAVYRARPDVNAVVHCHCPYLRPSCIQGPVFIPTNSEQQYLSHISEVKTDAPAIRHSILANFFPYDISLVGKSPCLHNLQPLRQQSIWHPQIKVAFGIGYFANRETFNLVQRHRGISG